MAERRMFAKTIIDSDAFLDLPPAAQLLYFHLAMRADDDGFVNKPKSVLRLTGCGEDALQRLVEENFLLGFDGGIVVIRHWKAHNRIRKDTYKETIYKAERCRLEVDENDIYCLAGTGALRVRDEDVTDTLRQDRLGEDRSGKDRSGKSREESGDAALQPARRFAPPSPEEVMQYCQMRGNTIDAERFVSYYESNGWMVGRNKMKDWKAAVRSWEQKENIKSSSNVFLEMVGVT